MRMLVSKALKTHKAALKYSKKNSNFPYFEVNFDLNDNTRKRTKFKRWRRKKVLSVSHNIFLLSLDNVFNY